MKTLTISKWAEMVSIDISWESFQKFQIILNFQEALKPFTPNPEHSRRKGLQMEWKPQARIPVFENFGNPVPHMVVLFSGNSRKCCSNCHWKHKLWKFKLEIFIEWEAPCELHHSYPAGW